VLHNSSANVFAKHLTSLFLMFLFIILFFSSAAAEPSSRVSELYSLPSHTFITTEDGSLWGWGDNRDGKLGDGTTMNRPIPIKSSLENVSALYPQSSGHTFALTDDGRLWAWERNWDGRIGAGRDANEFPEPVLILSNVEHLYPNERHSFALKSDGTLWAWGNNSHGQLGDGTTTSRFEPVLVELENISEVVPKHSSTFAILEDGTLWAWGNNSYGKLGDGSTLNRSIPVQILDNVDSVYPQRTHTLALDNSSNLWAWGHNNYGQLGNGSGDNSNQPVRVDLQGVQEVFSEEYHSFALTSDNTLWAWGYNWYGQLGDGSVMNRRRPVQVNIDNIRELYPQQHHTFALKNDNTLWGWGRNWDGRIGDNSNSYNRTRPVLVAESISQAYPLDRHAYALNQDGTASAWGNNSKDQLGSGSGSSVNTPQQIPLEDVSGIYAQDTHAFAVKDDGSLWAWGRNNKGQLGTGSYDNQSAPARVLFGDDLPTFYVFLQADPDQGGVLTGTGTYRQGENATVSASENEGYTFINWTENGEEVSTEKDFSFTVARDRDLVANFDAPEDTDAPAEEEEPEEPEMYEVDLSVNPEASGTVDGAGSYEEGTEITISAEAEEGFVFVNWTEDDEEITDSAEYDFTVTTDRNLTANFEPDGIDDRDIYEIKLSASPEEAGQVFGSGEYREGDEVIISAEAEEGFKFVSWTEIIIESDHEEGYDVGEYVDVSDEAEYSFIIERDRVLIANFKEVIEEPDTYKLELNAEPESGGTLEGSGAYEEGEEVEISATAEEGYEFINWTYNEEEISSAAEFVYTMPAEDLLFTAHFSIVESEPEIEAVSAANGEVTVSFDQDLSEAPEANDFSAFYISSADQQDQDPASDVYSDDNNEWNNLDLTGSSWGSEDAARVELYFEPFEAGDDDIKYTVKVSYRDGDAVQAEPFTVEAEEPEEPETFKLELSAEPESGGTLEGSGTYEAGEEVEIKASAGEGYEFINWTYNEEEISSAAEFVYTMPAADLVFTAHFTVVETEPEVESVNAANAEITVRFNKELSEAPEINDFSAFYISSAEQNQAPAEDVYSEGSHEWNNLELTGSSWNIGDAEQVELYFEPFAQGDEDTDYTVKVSYRDGDAVQAEPFTVEAEEPGTFELTLLPDPSDGGAAKGSGKYREGETVTIEATAAEGYEFILWTIDGDTKSMEEIFTYTMPAEDVNIVAVFDEEIISDNGSNQEDNDTESSNGDYESVREALESRSDQNGEVFYIEVSYHSEESPAVTGEGYYEYGDQAVVKAETPAGYELYCWYEGDQIASFEENYVFTVTRDRRLTAWFEPESAEEIYNINIKANPENGGTVLGGGVYPSDDTAVLQAIPDTRYDFIKWTENDSVVSTEAEYAFGVTRDRNLTANFELISYEGNQINGDNDELEYQSERIKNNGTINLYIPENSTPGPVETFNISLFVEPDSSGEVFGAGNYEENKLVGLDAVPAKGYEFTGWMEDNEKVSMAKAYAFLAQNDRELVATFAPLVNRSSENAETFRISLAPSPLEGGRVYGRGEYTEGKTITVSALPNIDYNFISWTEDGQVVSTEIIYTFIVERDHQLVANFASYDSSDPDNPGSGYRYEFDSFLHGYFPDFLTPYNNTYKYREPYAESNYGWSPAYVPPAGGQ